MLFFLLCLYTSLYYVRPTDWMPGLLNEPLFLVVGVICTFILCLTRISKKNPILQSGPEFMMLGLAAAILCSHLSHAYVGGAIESIKNFMPVMVGYFLVVTAIDSQKKLNAFIVVLVLLTTFLACEGWLQHKTGYAHGGMDAHIEQKTDAEGVTVEVPRIRWYGVFNDPNDLGLALVIVLPFLLNMVLNKKYLLPVMCLPLITIAAYLTNSRGSILAALVSIGAYFVIRYRNIKAVVVSLILIAVLLAFGPSRMAQLSSSEESAHGRVDAWYQGYQMFKAHPMFGVGQGMFTEYHPVTAHNSFVLVMAELGITGTIFFSGLFYYSFSWIWKNIFLSKENTWSKPDSGQLCAVFGSLFGLMAAMFFLSRAYVLIPFIFLALSTATIRVSTSASCVPVSDVLPFRYHFKNILFITFLQIVFINVVVKLII